MSSDEQIKQTLLATIEGLKQNPAACKVVFRATTELGDGLQCKGTIRDFPAMTIDEPPELGGKDSGPNPVEIVLVALGTCQEIVYRAYASVMGIKLDSVKVDVRGYLDLRGLFAMEEGVPAGYQKIVFETQIQSSASDEELQKLAQIVEAHCPVLNTLEAPVEVKGNLVINGKAAALAEATA